MEEKGVFVNFTNHSSRQWGEEQRSAAWEYGMIVDVPFPEVDPYGDQKHIMKLAEAYTEQIMQMHPKAVLCQGEFCLVYQMVLKLKEKGVEVLSACSERIVEIKDEKKVITFRFRQFREY